LAEDQAQRGAKDRHGRARGFYLPAGNESDGALMVGLGRIGMDQGVQSRQDGHGLKRQKETEQQRGSALPLLSENFHGEHSRHDDRNLFDDLANASIFINKKSCGGLSVPFTVRFGHPW
jgi:hypothetical protein